MVIVRFALAEPPTFDAFAPLYTPSQQSVSILIFSFFVALSAQLLIRLISLWYLSISSIPKKKWEFITADDLEKACGKAIRPNDVLIINTGWHRVYEDGDYFAYGLLGPCPTGVVPVGATGYACASFNSGARGSGTLEQWDSIAMVWVPVTLYGPVTFTGTVYDTGQIKVCKSKTNCTLTDNPDWFGIQFDPVPNSVIRESSPFTLSKGSIKAS